MGWSAGKQGFRGCVRHQEATGGEGITHKHVRPCPCFAQAQPLSPEAGGSGTRVSLEGASDPHAGNAPLRAWRGAQRRGEWSSQLGTWHRCSGWPIMVLEPGSPYHLSVVSCASQALRAWLSSPSSSSVACWNQPS